MTVDDQPYKGFKSLKMDPKFRVSIQAAWRPQPGAMLFLLLAKQYEMPVVKVLSQEAYNERVAVIKNSDKTPAEKSRRLGDLAMRCREATLNEQGKLLVPKDLSEQVGIEAEGDVVLAGRGIYFEIWSKTQFAKFLEIRMAEQEDDELGTYA